MDLIALDFETYYDKQYSLSKLTTEEYIRDDRFEVIGLSVKINNGPTQWAAGEEAAGDLLAATDFTNAAILCHNTMFDGAILNWHYQINPKMWLDTLCMGRALHGTEHSVALKSLAQRYGVGVKGTEVADAMGKRIEDFAADELEQYGRYCSNDVDLTVALFRLMAKKFPKKELQLIDLTLRMFIEPMLDLDEGLLEQHLEDTRDAKDKLLIAAGGEKTEFMRQRERHHMEQINPFLLCNKNTAFLTDEERIQKSRMSSLRYYYTHKKQHHTKSRGRPKKNELR